MSHPPVLLFHIGAAIVGLVSGFTALFARKGGRLHRRSGTVFLVSMLCMAASATYLALVKTQMINAVVGALTCYLVATAWWTVKRKSRRSDAFDLAALLTALLIGASAVFFGLQAARSLSGADPNGIPAPAYFVFGSVAWLAAAMDIRQWIRGGPTGAQRLARHLWRMGFALLITSVSFFNGPRNHVLPALVRETPLHDLPTLLAGVLSVFWLVRVLFFSRPRRRLRGLDGRA